jgi:hypothetical protein
MRKFTIKVQQGIGDGAQFHEIEVMATTAADARQLALVYYGATSRVLLPADLISLDFVCEKLTEVIKEEGPKDKPRAARRKLLLKFLRRHDVRAWLQRLEESKLTELQKIGIHETIVGLAKAAGLYAKSTYYNDAWRWLFKLAMDEGLIRDPVED